MFVLLMTYYYLLGGLTSVQIVMEKFQEFSRATGLCVNPSKCKLYCGGVGKHNSHLMEEVTGL